MKDRFTRRMHQKDLTKLCCVKSMPKFIWSDVVCVEIRNENFQHTIQNDTDPWRAEMTSSSILTSHLITQQLWKDFFFFFCFTFIAIYDVRSFIKLQAQIKKLKVYTCQVTQGHQVSFPRHIWFEWRGEYREYCVLRTSKYVSQSLSQSCRSIIPDKYSLAQLVLSNQQVNTYFDNLFVEFRAQ